MKNALLLCALLASASQAQSLTVIQAHRVAEASTRGVDWGYQDSRLDARSTTATGTWDQTALAVQVSPQGRPVARGTCRQISSVGTDQLGFDLAATAETYGNHLLESGRALGTYDLDVHVPAVARYLVTADARVTSGTNVAQVRLEDGSGSALFDLTVAHLGSDSSLGFGWLSPGDYRFSGHAEVSAVGDDLTTSSQTGRATGQLRLFHPADFDLNGQVDGSDVYWVVWALVNGHPAGDVDGDGDFDLDDWNRYLAYWSV